MPTWRPLPRIAFATCTYPFQPSSTADLPLEIGDELYIIEQGGKDGAWYRGYLVAPPSLLAGLTSVKGQTLEARVFSGIFPRCCVEIREVLGENKLAAHDEDRLDKSSSPAGKPDSRSTHRDFQTNGIASPAPSETASARSPTPLGQSQSLKRSSRPEPLPLNTRSPSRRKSTRRRGESQGSQWTNKSDQPQQRIIPLSPLSVSTPDRNAPRPLAPVPMLKIGDETPTSAQEPLVDEIASCLREWHSTKVHELLLGTRYRTAEKMWSIAKRLDNARRQLLHGLLTAHELEKVREAAVWDLVKGNRLLSSDIIVRSPSQRGRMLTSDDSAIKITQLQAVMSLMDEKPAVTTDENTRHHLLVSITGVVGELVQTPLQANLYLCIKTPGSSLMPISEAFALDLPIQDGKLIVGDSHQLKTLFTDLSSTDIGEGAGSGTELFLVFKILCNEPYHGATLAKDSPSAPRVSTSSSDPSPMQSTIGSIKGRKSAMFGHRTRKESDPSNPTDNRPISSDSQPNKKNGIRPDSARATPKEQKVARRTVAVGTLRVDQIIRAREEKSHSFAIWAPAAPFDEMDEDQTGWDDLLKDLLTSPTGNYKSLQALSEISVHLKAFTNPDAEKLIEMTPTLLFDVSQNPKIGFSGAPTKARSDIYLTLVNPFLPKNGFLSHPKLGTVNFGQPSSMSNLQLTLEVRKSNGERIEGCIYPSSNSAGHTAWRTPAIEWGEAWNMTLRLAITPEDVPGCHIVMSIADAPEFPFALAWMPLWSHDAFIRDGDHSLVLYRYDEYTSSMISGKGAYLALPWSSKRKDETVTGAMASLTIRTYLCSTKYSQDPNILGLLKWRDQDTPEVGNILRRFLFVPEIEIVKLLNEVLGALFEIFVEYAGNDEYEDLCFNALINVLGIVHDRRFQLGPLVDSYAATKFNYPFATAGLMRSFTRLFSKLVDLDTSRTLRATFKVGSHVFRFIIKARQQQKEKEAGIGITSRQPTFTKDLQEIFKSFEELMKNSDPRLIGTKTLLVQNFHTWLPEMSTLMTPGEILKVASNFIGACSDVQGKLILYKLVLIINLSNLSVFKEPTTRRALLHSTVQWLSPYWGQTTTVSDQWKAQVRLCCSVVASQVEELGQEACEYIPKLVDSYRAIQLVPTKTNTTLSLLFPTAYPFPTRSIVAQAEFEEALIEISAVLAAMADLPTIVHSDWPKADLADFLFGALQVYISILDGEAFPKSWLSVNIYHHKSTLKTLEKLANVLIDSFIPHPDEADQFNTELWRAFFDALLKLVGSTELALETFPEQKRRAVWKIAGDVREQGADLLHRTWEAIGWETSSAERKQFGLEKLGGFQVQYVPGLVAPIVELCLSVHEGLRSVAIEILQTMIVSEWSLSQDLSLIQAEMIDCLDRMFKTTPMTESILQKLFIGELIDLFEPLSLIPDEPLYLAVKTLITTIDELLDLLVAVHGVEGNDEVFHIMDTLHLMEFMKDMQKEDIYIRYVHQLAQLQLEAGHATEAGLALRLHAEIYEWDPSVTVEALGDPLFPVQTAFERKEQLYFQMIKYFEDGFSWENALATYTELAKQYEHNIFDFSKLSRTQRAMATIYERISRGERQNPRYFRVVYKGLGFPISLRDKQFIFEGAPNDHLVTFADRLQALHPSAQILSAGMEEELEGQYLQVFPVGPQKDLMHPIYQRPKIPQPIKDYYLLSRPSRFTATSKRQLGEANILEQRVEKTLYTTAEPFPTILGRSEIVSVGSVTLTPLQSAIERTTRKTAELATLEKKGSSGEDSSLTLLTEALMHALNVSNETNVVHYRKLLPALNDVASEANDEVTVNNPLENTLKVALMDYALVLKRCLALYSRPAQQATKADLAQRLESAFGLELALLAPPAQQFLYSPADVWLASTTSLLPSVASPFQPSELPNGSSASPGSDVRPTRHDKNRPSLNFLKRTQDVSQELDKVVKQTETKPAEEITEERSSNMRDRSQSRSRSKDPNKSRQNLLHNTFTNDSNGISSSQQSLNNDDRPETNKSDHSFVPNLGGRMGSVKKRLSAFNIGKKASKNNFKVKVNDRLEEE